MTFETYSSERKKKKKKIWDELLKINPRSFKSVIVKDEIQIRNPDLSIPSPNDGS